MNGGKYLLESVAAVVVAPAFAAAVSVVDGINKSIQNNFAPKLNNIIF